MIYKLSPSILAADVSCLGQQLQAVEKAGAEYIHIDVMDGVFVPNISFGLPVVRGLRSHVDSFFDVHLMIVNPIQYVERFAQAGADGITVHAEACEDLEKTIDTIRGLGKQAGVAISPDTGIEAVLPVLEKLSMVLVMTVHPGYGGQKIMTETFDKVRKLRKIAEEKGLPLDIEVDGGINPDNVTEVQQAGANVFVAGTKIFRGDIEENVRNFKRKLNAGG
ncbi:MAG: ribulose-phosphate 3-epimerase [Lachnospiraceae bacterium]|nr:ribulose-phosphate 3-epimerase [Lachnospiraceae bacterium]